METQISKELTSRKLPGLLACGDGKTVKDEAGWKIRRAEIEALLKREFCGVHPDFPLKVKGVITSYSIHYTKLYDGITGISLQT